MCVSTCERSLFCDLFLVKDNISLHVSSVYLDQICPDKDDDSRASLQKPGIFWRCHDYHPQQW